MTGVPYSIGIPGDHILMEDWKCWGLFILETPGVPSLMKEWFYASIRQPHGSAGSPLIRATPGKPLLMKIAKLKTSVAEQKLSNLCFSPSIPIQIRLISLRKPVSGMQIFDYTDLYLLVNI